MTGLSGGQVPGVYETGFTTGSLARIGARDRIWMLGIKVTVVLTKN